MRRYKIRFDYYSISNYIQFTPLLSKLSHHQITEVNFIYCTQQNNANTKLLDSDGRSCLYYATSAGDSEVVDLLTQNGCPPATDPKQAEILDKLHASVI